MYGACAHDCIMDIVTTIASFQKVNHTYVFLFLAQYFGATIIMLATSVSVSVFIICAHYKGDYGYRVPVIIRKVVLEWMATVLQMKTMANVATHTENVSYNYIL